MIRPESSINIPDTVIIEPESGLAINIPVSQQWWPGWWEEMPDTYNRILELRKKHGIVIDDFPEGTERTVPKRTYVPMGEDG
jgi:hypothetical protein